MSVRLRLSARQDSVRRARAAIDHLDSVVGRGLTADLRLLVSELVTNSVIHSGMEPNQSVELRVDAGAETVRVEVADPGPGVAGDPPAEPSPERVGGRGLWLVDKLASRWGVTRGSSNSVWLEIDRVDRLSTTR